ncbi:MAG: GtrA family protein [Methylovirgula sp.]|uniref:GtrA family protein n=1 Tax=Methylovirgula sp. TaxID=1978224 RepID=UPI00307654F8
MSFGMIGLINTIAYAAISIAFVHCGINAIVASLFAYLLCALWSYWTNARFTFESRAPHAVAAPRFLGMTILSGGIATTILFVLHKIGVSIEMALVLTSVSVPMANYAAAEFFVFRSPA